ncbi:uncharacterized protein LOC111708543 [Eurytemora carolleeae]|uniref:uncharacterized protein LOC111708543 n=1 Tax=Eurytemora carolleeae TaxID=1294199 RepID=UPI000C7655EA|nr:uncharacterized protein LOC111708543 [Eurytemora carolleeae]|eukprot:XP_023337717.1 uncharacterized protein LOC111708543 [Eurytemora affinis]
MVGLRSLILLIFPLLVYTQSSLRRCYTCRSRGQQGDCKDPFTPPEPRIPGLPLPSHTAAVHEIPCSSGWCQKTLDGLDKNDGDDFGIATERACMQRGPSDGKERCAYVKVRATEVYMCFCKGDLCNSSRNILPSLSILIPSIILIYNLL